MRRDARDLSMKSAPIVQSVVESLRAGSRPRVKPVCRPRLADPLERRVVLSTAALPTVAMLDVATTDSKSVTVEYRVTPTPGSDSGQPLTFGVYRSADATFDADDVAVTGAAAVSVSYDDAGGPAAAAGNHSLTISLPDGLPIDTAHPYVLVVANPQSSQATTNPSQTASFRKYTIGVVTHGGIQNTSWKNGPPWELQIGQLMKQRGFDAVIPYNWVRESGTPGAAVKQGPRLANLVLRAAAGFDSADPVDIQFIGHSEGTVVNTVAMVRLQKQMTPQISAGYIEATILDPHAANNSTPGRDFSTEKTLLGGIADAYIRNYQGNAKDPQVFIPSMVDDAQVFYQHSKAPSGGWYNLWGQIPVAGAAAQTHYFNLSAMGVTHSGKKGVPSWYLNFVAPTLGGQSPLVNALKLDGGLATPSLPVKVGARAVRTISGNQATFAGNATPGASVRLYMGPAADPSTIGVAAQTTADSAGRWSITTGALPAGQYRAVAMSSSKALQTRPGLAVVPMATLGTFRVDAAG
jgi:hypothetical protein